MTLQQYHMFDYFDGSPPKRAKYTKLVQLKNKFAKKWCDVLPPALADEQAWHDVAEKIRQAQIQGASLSDIGKLLGVSRARVQDVMWNKSRGASPATRFLNVSPKK